MLFYLEKMLIIIEKSKRLRCCSESKVRPRERGSHDASTSLITELFFTFRPFLSRSCTSLPGLHRNGHSWSHTHTLKAHYLGHIVHPCHLILQPWQRKVFWCGAPAGVLVAGRCPRRPPGLPLGSLPTSEDPPATAC